MHYVPLSPGLKVMDRERERENILWVNLPFSVTSCDPNCRRIADPVAGRRCCDKQPLDLEHLGTFNDIDIVFLRNVDWFIDDIEFLRYSWPQKTYVGVRFARKSGWYDHLAAGCKVEDEGAWPQSLRRGIFDIRPCFFWTYIYHIPYYW